MRRKEDEEKLYNYSKEELSLADFLAADRTLLASERTLLAYIRTGIGTLAIAITIIKLFDYKYTYVLGGIFIILSIAPIVVGLYRYKKLRRKLENILFK